tara:strand:+ start:461 stop:775 length:315 start_codon:yes stop_codon:yes gene_type:complete
MKVILYIALFTGIITYLFWGFMPKGSFYVGNSFFIMMLCIYIYLKDKESCISFILFSLALNNLLDELFFDNTKLELNEIMVGLAIIIFAIIKRKNDRKISRNNK